MSSPPEDESLGPEREPEPHEQAALEWVVRHQRGLQPAEERDFQAWLLADARHAALFREFGGTWSALGRLPPPLFATPAKAVHSSPARHRILALAAAALVAAGAALWWLPEQAGVPVETKVGTLRELRLPDGSVVQLNTASGLDPLFSPTERRIRLRQGEAYFEVAKDPHRPFVVEAAGVEMRALGTAFNVRLHAATVDLLVTEGRVRVDRNFGPPSDLARTDPPTLQPREVAAGHRLILPTAETVAAPAATPARVSDDELQRLLGWRTGELRFSDAALGEIVAEFNRHHRRPLRISDPGLAQVRFGGVFRAEDQAGFIRLLRENFGLRVEVGPEETILHAPAGSRGGQP